MSVYVFGGGRSVYGDSLNSNKIVSGLDTSSNVSVAKHQLSTMVLRENTKASELIEYGNALRSELEEIRQIFFKDPKPEQMKEYEKYQRVQQKILSYISELTELYVAYEAASQLTANRKPALRSKILSVGMKLSALIRSYNASGIFASNDLVVTIPTPSSYEEVMRRRLLQALEA